MYDALGAIDAVYSAIPNSSSGFPQSILETTIPFTNNSGLTATLSGSSTHSSFDGDYTWSSSSNMSIGGPYQSQTGTRAPYYWFQDTTRGNASNQGDVYVTSGTGAGQWTTVNNDPQYNYGIYVYYRIPNDNAVTWYDTAGNATTENMGVLTLSFPSTLRIKLTSI